MGSAAPGDGRGRPARHPPRSARNYLIARLHSRLRADDALKMLLTLGVVVPKWRARSDAESLLAPQQIDP